MRKFLASILLVLTLFPSVHSALEAWDHSHHSHAAACEEEGTHMHPQEVHCELNHFAFLSTPWEPQSFQCTPHFPPAQTPQTGYESPAAVRGIGKTDARGPPSGNLFANV
ncbi:MAG: hypothetical protein VW420_02485 [Schleiferiaceae bacterium]|jgi:hypothetical protein